MTFALLVIFYGFSYFLCNLCSSIIFLMNRFSVSIVEFEMKKYIDYYALTSFKEKSAERLDEIWESY